MEPAAFDRLDRGLRSDDPGAALDGLADELAGRGQFRGMLDALLLRARLDLGLPLARPGALDDLPEPMRSRYEDRSVAAIRRVGTLILEAGEVAAAWSYFRAIGEPGPVAEAIDRFDPGEGEDADGRLDEVIDVALGQGAHPRRGFDLVLDHHGTCSALTAFDSLPADPAVRRHAAARLARRLHADLLANLRAEFGRRGEPIPPVDAPIGAWLDGRPGLFEDDGYHLDVSHLAMVVRLAPLADDPGAIGLAAELAEYGRRLSPRLQAEGEPPFDEFYADHAAYLQGLLGEDADAAVELFRSRLGPPDPADREAPLRAQALVRLLDRLGRIEEAFAVAVDHLGRVPEGALGEPGLESLGRKLGRLDRLADLARLNDEPAHYAALVLEDHERSRGG